MLAKILIFAFFLFWHGNSSFADEYHFKDGKVEEGQAVYADGPYLELRFLKMPHQNQGLLIYDIEKVKGPSSYSSSVYERSYELLSQGNRYFFKGQYRKALDYYQKAIDINPLYIYAYHNRAVVFMTEYKYDEAINEFNNILNIDKNNPAAYFDLGIIYGYLENWPLAKDYFEKAKKYFLQIKDKNISEMWAERAEDYIQQAQAHMIGH